MVSSHHFINISSCKNNNNDNKSIDNFPNFSMNTSELVHVYDKRIHTKILHVNLQFIVFSNVKYIFLDMGYSGVKQINCK